ncbi:unnamed protein product [Phytomonas sp. EM1]|nr:unnamed protein product [Phytomonas sp. EM1]|eukprot:CCW64500.1 unnamed protein product [Phytomonas sp. isolate EM1]
MSTWADKLKKNIALPQDPACKPDHEPTMISPGEETKRTPVEAPAEPVVADPSPVATSMDAAARELQPKLSFVDLGPVALPVELASFISEEFTFGEMPVRPPSEEIAAPPEPTVEPQGPSKPDDAATTPSVPSHPPANETIRRPPSRRQPQRGRYTNPNANPYGRGRYASQRNPYYINNGFGEALIQYNLRHQSSPHPPHHYDPDHSLGGVDPSRTPPMYHPNDVGSLPHPHLLDSNAVAYRPSYMFHSGLYYSGQLQPWPPYYPPPTVE